jgi:flagellar motor switch protein FliN/FliY
MADDVVPVSIVQDRATGAAGGGGNGAPAPTTASPRRPASPLSGVAAGGHTPIFKELPRQQSAQSLNLDLLRDVELTVKIELGRTRLRLDDVLRLSSGAIVELDRLAGDPVDVFVNDRLIARGDVVVVDDKFAVRLTEVVSPIQG